MVSDEGEWRVRLRGRSGWPMRNRGEDELVVKYIGTKLFVLIGKLSGRRRIGILSLISTYLPPLPCQHSTQTPAKSLIKLLLNPDPALRISAAAALDHPWFALFPTTRVTSPSVAAQPSSGSIGLGSAAEGADTTTEGDALSPRIPTTAPSPSSKILNANIAPLIRKRHWARTKWRGAVDAVRVLNRMVVRRTGHTLASELRRGGGRGFVSNPLSGGRSFDSSVGRDEGGLAQWGLRARMASQVEEDMAPAVLDNGGGDGAGPRRVVSELAFLQGDKREWLSSVHVAHKAGMSRSDEVALSAVEGDVTVTVQDGDEPDAPVDTGGNGHVTSLAGHGRVFSMIEEDGRED
ncbi:hypothetical protein HDU93_001477, partial [Gonapodya sp. JEL0774]